MTISQLKKNAIDSQAVLRKAMMECGNHSDPVCKLSRSIRYLYIQLTVEANGK